MIPDHKVIGGRVQARRRAQKRTQENLAEYLGVSVAYVSQLERGVSKINLDRLARISEWLGCQPTDLLSEEVSTSNHFINELIVRGSLLNESQQHVVLDLIESLLKNT